MSRDMLMSGPLVSMAPVPVTDPAAIPIVMANRIVWTSAIFFDDARTRSSGVGAAVVGVVAAGAAGPAGAADFGVPPPQAARVIKATAATVAAAGRRCIGPGDPGVGS